jgi:hypothetical protein
LFPLVERPSQEDYVASVVPGEGLPHIRVFNLFFGNTVGILDFAECSNGYPEEEWMKLTVLFMSLFLVLNEPCDWLPI